MKQTLKVSFLMALMVVSIAFAGKTKEEIKVIPIGNAVTSEQANAASSPWLPRNLETATSQYKVAEFKKNGFVLIAGAKTTAPMLGNYYGYYSKDSGKSFTRFSFPNFQSSATSTSMRFASIASWGDSVMVKADYNGVIMRSTNYGSNWDTVSGSYGVPGDAFYDGVHFVSKDTVIAHGDGVDSTIYIARSTNRGATWSRVVVPGNLSPNFKTYIYASAGSRGIASVGSTVYLSAYSADAANVTPILIKSTDAGLTWTATEYPTLGAKRKWSITNLAFKDANTGYALITNSYTQSMHKTTDGGATWSDTVLVTGVTNVLNQQFTSISVVAGTSVVYASGYDGVAAATWKSTNDGATWTKLVTPGPLSGAQTSLALVQFIGENVGIGAGTRQVVEYKPSVELTFRVNTSSVPDTIKSTSTVQMRGDGGASGGLLDWNGASSVRFANIGGDYWQVKARFVPGTSFPYKIFTNVIPNVGAGHASEHSGWEGNLSDVGQGDNRKMIVGNNDSTIALEFVNGSPTVQLQYWRPYTETDSMEVTFRVNMANQEDFNPATMTVGVRGGLAPLDWGKSFILKREANDGNNGTRYPGGHFWSGTMKFPYKKAYTDTITVPVRAEYKFVQMAAAAAPTADPLKWEDGILAAPDVASNRFFDIKRGSADTTLYWKWWANVGAKPPAGTDTASVIVRVDMSRAIQTNGYTVGDTVQVRYGFANSASVVGSRNLKKVGLTFVYADTFTVTGVNLKADGTGKPLVYQYYLVKNGQDFREVYYNFAYTGSDVTLAERRLLPITAKTTTSLDTSKNLSNANRWPFWRNTRKLTQNVDVKFTVNLQPAYYQVLQGAVGKDTLYDIQGPWTINKGLKDSVYKWGVSINGPAAGGWATWGTSLYADASRKLYDDGTNGDAVANDRIYTRVIKFYKDSVNNVVGQEFKFGIRGGDNEGGKGGFGNNHIENINDAAATASIHSQFGSINPLYYDRWLFAEEKAVAPVSVSLTDASIPTVYALDQNFPNPFNPTTSINYSIPFSGLVSLKVFNVLGQEVATLVNAQQAAGYYSASFNASSLSSGVYFYKIEAGNYTSVKKMMLLK